MASFTSAPLDRLKTLPRRTTAIVLAVVVTLLLLHSVTRGPAVSSYRYSKDALRRDSWKTTANYDIEDVNMMRESIHQVVRRLPIGKSHRVIIYSKGEMDSAGLEELRDMADEVVTVPNVGREGETYLSHIVRHYDSAETNIAPHTIFMQPHLAWDFIFLPRLEHCMDWNTGYLSFGPYLNQTCGHDSAGQVHPRMADIYTMFKSDFCPPEPVLETWAGQFVVSRKRILDNPLRTYSNLLGMFHKPADHWIWKEGWHNNEPSNPTLGHALERTWPVIFDCTDIRIAETCHDSHGSHCQCLD